MTTIGKDCNDELIICITQNAVIRIMQSFVYYFYRDPNLQTFENEYEISGI